MRGVDRDGGLSTDQKAVSCKNRWQPTDATHAAARTCARPFRADSTHIAIQSGTHGSDTQAGRTCLPDAHARSPPLIVVSRQSRSGRKRTRAPAGSRRPGRLRSLLLPVLQWLLPLSDASLILSPSPPIPTYISHSSSSSSSFFLSFTSFSI